jgi:hypothetical protein
MLSAGSVAAAFFRPPCLLHSAGAYRRPDAAEPRQGRRSMIVREADTAGTREARGSCITSLFVTMPAGTGRRAASARRGRAAASWGMRATRVPDPRRPRTAAQRPPLEVGENFLTRHHRTLANPREPFATGSSRVLLGGTQPGLVWLTMLRCDRRASQSNRFDRRSGSLTVNLARAT